MTLIRAALLRLLCASIVYMTCSSSRVAVAAAFAKQTASPRALGARILDGYFHLHPPLERQSPLPSGQSLFHKTVVAATKLPKLRFPSCRFSSSGSSPAAEIQHIGLAQMQEIVEDYENGGRESSQYCVIDVRTEEEVAATGKVGEHVYTLPVQIMGQYKVWDMDADNFEELCRFPKPTPDETLVFTCAAGIRSVYASQFAAAAGYTKIINYMGGANEWFSPANDMR
jgi:rhodanese-related sulfurtransferase